MSETETKEVESLDEMASEIVEAIIQNMNDNNLDEMKVTINGETKTVIREEKDEN